MLYLFYFISHPVHVISMPYQKACERASVQFNYSGAWDEKIATSYTKKETLLFLVGNGQF